MALAPADRLAVAGVEAALVAARDAADARSALEVIAGALADLGVRGHPVARSADVLGGGMEAWLRRLSSGGRSASSLRAYRTAIEDFTAWAQAQNHSGGPFEERALVAYLDDYRRRRDPAPATYHRHFLLLRRYVRWLSRVEGVPDPFLELEAPPRPRQEGDWLTPEEFARMLRAAAAPARRLPGLAERDRLVLLTLVMTGLRRSELIALSWGDIDLQGRPPSLLVRRGKGGKPRRQPLATPLASELERARGGASPAPDQPVFSGLRGARLQPTILANIIRRAAQRADIQKRITAHTLRHTAATWLRQATGDARLVAEYLGHADLSTVSRYAHVAPAELVQAAAEIATRAGLSRVD